MKMKQMDDVERMMFVADRRLHKLVPVLIVASTSGESGNGI
jgi:hypothetical protein